jgi:hypothetical protein
MRVKKGEVQSQKKNESLKEAELGFRFSDLRTRPVCFSLSIIE